MEQVGKVASSSMIRDVNNLRCPKHLLGMRFQE